MMKTTLISVLIFVAANSAMAGNFEDGLADGEWYCENEFSGDTDDCWGIEDRCEAVIEDEFTIEQGDSPSDRSYKRGGKAGVKKALRKIERECFGSNVQPCLTLGEDAAAELAFKMCPVPKYPSGGKAAKSPPDYKEECRIEAIDICEGMIASKFYSICPAGSSLSQSDLQDSKKDCKKTVESLLGMSLRH